MAPKKVPVTTTSSAVPTTLARNHRRRRLVLVLLFFSSLVVTAAVVIPFLVLTSALSTPYNPLSPDHLDTTSSASVSDSINSRGNSGCGRIFTATTTTTTTFATTSTTTSATTATAALASHILHLSHYLKLRLHMLAMALRSLFAAGVLASALLPSAASASLLYVTSYGGTVSTFNLTSPAANSTDLKWLASTEACNPAPSWLTLDRANSTIYCLGEGSQKEGGSITSFRTANNGSLVPLARVKTIDGPVSAVIYGEGGRGLAVAQYSGSTLSSFSIANRSTISPIQVETFNLTKPGANPARQEASHPHEVLTDPTGQFLVSPDLGADLVRIYRLDGNTLKRTAVDPLKIKAGRGPRHGTFLKTKTKTLFFLVTELTSNVITYEAVYGNSTLSFKELYTTTTHGQNATIPAGSTAAEVALSPDNKFLLVSTRGEGGLKIPSFEAVNGTANATITSDPLVTYSVNEETGALDLIQTSPAGGISPRHFSINKAGDRVAVALKDERVVIIERDVKSGKLGNFVAHANIKGEITGAFFYE